MEPNIAIVAASTTAKQNGRMRYFLQRLAVWPLAATEYTPHLGVSSPTRSNFRSGAPHPHTSTNSCWGTWAPLLGGSGQLPGIQSGRLWSGWRPITGWKRNVPKVRCRLPELDSHFCRTRKLLLSEHDAAFLLFPTERVLQNELLISDYFGVQTDQCAMGTDHQGAGPFGKGQAQFL